MPYLAQGHYPIPTKDLLTWMFDDRLPYDEDKPVRWSTHPLSRGLIQLVEVPGLIRQTRYISTLPTRPGRYHVDKHEPSFAGLQLGFEKLV